jgi:hypothetical protein
MDGRVLVLRTEIDGVLAAVAPLGLASAAGTALVIDLDPDGPPYRSERSLAEIVAEGPRANEMSATRQGVAVIRNGGVDFAASAETVHRMISRWPAVVLRAGREPLDRPVVPVVPLLPGVLAPREGRAAVWQAVGSGAQAPGPGPVLPILRRSVLVRLLGGVIEPRSRWVAAWRVVWSLPWR